MSRSKPVSAGLVWLKPVKIDSSLSETVWSGLMRSNQVKTGLSRLKPVLAGLEWFQPVKTGLSRSKLD
ncbi:hypothetical protein CPC197_2021 [Chlamydia psittaci C1/97]|nr:hypothetical protein CPC197_2021 [Chlamydia psittaci C1/97]